MSIKPKYWLIIILILASFLRLYRLGYPNAYVFDEVYHAFTAKEYLKWSPIPWEWWNTPPPGVAYEWTHPPLAKEFMTLSMLLLKSQDAWAWRFPGAILGIISVFLVYKLAKLLFNNEPVALVSAFLFSIDGLNFVQSRTGMNDIYLVTFMLACLYYLLKKKYFFSSIFLGLALASKWSALYLFGFVLLVLIIQVDRKKPLLILKKYLPFLLVPPILYLVTYIPFFLLGHNVSQFIELQRQMWYYHSHLKATHDYASSWWSWPLDLYPVWFYVQYYPNNVISNIFTFGNPVLFWAGTGAVLVTIWDFIKLKSKSLFVILLGFFIFWLPWAFSPRIMFLYHFSPCVPFLSMCLGYQIATIPREQKSSRVIVYAIVGLIILSFILVYPFLVGIPLDKKIMLLFFKINAAKNPFGG